MVWGVASMYDDYFTFRSVTTAMRGSRILEAMGIQSLTVRTPKQLQQQGCGYSLKVRGDAAVRAKLALAQAEVRYSRVYRRDDSGQWQEVTL